MSSVLPLGVPQRADDAEGPRVDQDTRDRWGAMLVIVVWTWSVLPRVLQTLTAPKYRVHLGEDSIPDSAIAHLSDRGLTFFLLGFALLCLLRCHEPGQQALPLVLLVVLLPWFYVVVRDVFDHDRPRIDSFVYLMVVLAVWAIRPSLRVLVTLGRLTAFATVLCLALGAVLPDKAVFRLSSGEVVLADKAVLPWGTLIGFLTQGNNLGVFLALGLPFVCLLPNRAVRWSMVGLTLFALVWTASRGSMAAVVASTLVVAVLLPASARLRSWLGPLLASLPLVAVVMMPLVTTDPTAFTNRGTLWITGLAWWRESFWFGKGANWYSEVAMTSERVSSSAYHGHNELVHIGVTGGIVLVALVAVLLVAVAVAAGRWAPTTLAGVGYLAALTTTMMLERPLSFVDNLNLFPMVVVPVALLLFCRVERDPQEEDRPGDLLDGADRAAGGRDAVLLRARQGAVASP